MTLIVKLVLDYFQVIDYLFGPQYCHDRVRNLLLCLTLPSVFVLSTAVAVEQWRSQVLVK